MTPTWKTCQMREDFAVFILSHGRADRCHTYDTLKKHGYTGRVIILVDDEDDQVDEYQKRYGDQVYVFSKQAAIDITDSGNNQKKRYSVVFGRNYNFVVAEELGIKYFLQLDDDYTDFWYTFDNDRNYISKHLKIKDLDKIFEIMLEFYIQSNATAIAMSQSGDYIGGGNSTFAKLQRKGKFHRKVMNSFFCSTDRPFKFMGLMNEDVNTYTTLGLRGHLFITVPRLRLKQKATQSNAGGLTDMYLDLGTYQKSFHSVMYSPSCVKVAEMGVTDRRLHHLVKWANAAPMIVSEEYKKSSFCL